MDEFITFGKHDKDLRHKRIRHIRPGKRRLHPFQPNPPHNNRDSKKVINGKGAKVIKVIPAIPAFISSFPHWRESTCDMVANHCGGKAALPIVIPAQAGINFAQGANYCGGKAAAN